MTLFRNLVLSNQPFPSLEGLDSSAVTKDYEQSKQDLNAIERQHAEYNQRQVVLEAVETNGYVDSTFKQQIMQSIENLDQLELTSISNEAVNVYINPEKVSNSVKGLFSLLVKLAKWLATNVAKFYQYLVNVFKVSFSRREWLIKEVSKLSSSQRELLKQSSRLYFNNVDISLESADLSMYADAEFKTFDLAKLLNDVDGELYYNTAFTEAMVSIITKLLADTNESNYEKQYQQFITAIETNKKYNGIDLGSVRYEVLDDGQYEKVKVKRGKNIGTIDPDDFAENFFTLNHQKDLLKSILTRLETLRKDYAGNYGKSFVKDVNKLNGLSEETLNLIKECSRLVVQRADASVGLLKQVSRIDNQYCKYMKDVLTKGLATLNR